MWRPIETAPKDGTEIVLFIEGVAIQAKWDPELRTDGIPYGDGCWLIVTLPSHGCGCCSHDNADPTHWQPLPEPPQ